MSKRLIKVADSETIKDLRADNARLRAALKDTRHFFLGHFDDSCEECRRGDAVIREALGLKE